MAKLLIAPCDAKAARHAVMHWHYSKKMPIGRLLKYGIWEDGQFIGAMLFGRGASSSYGHAFGLEHNEVCELVRVAMTNHTTPVTRCIAIAVKQIKKTQPGLRLILSYADPDAGHTGTIYRAGAWVYLGLTDSKTKYLVDGQWVHQREVTSGAFGGVKRYTQAQMDSFPSKKTAPKHKFGMALDDEMQALLQTMKVDYHAP